MEILVLLIPMSVILVFLIAVVFWWSLRSGQFEDLEGPAYRILMDDDKPNAASTSPGKEPDAHSPQPPADSMLATNENVLPERGDR